MNWSNITIEQYQQILAIANTDLPDFNKSVELVKYIFNIDNETVLNMPIEKFKSYTSKLDFIEEPYEGEMITTFAIDGYDYEVVWQMQKRTAGQFIDLSELTKDSELINDNLHKILAVICLPKGAKYDGDIANRAEVFKKALTMDLVFPLAGFFLTILNASLPTIQDYLSQDITAKKKELMEMIKESMNIGDGTAHLTN